MKKILFYSLFILLSACAHNEKRTDREISSRKALEDSTRNTCFCDRDSNYNLISDSLRDLGMRRWKNTIAPIFPAGTSADSLPKGFRISIEDMWSLANLLNEKKNPPITDMMGYFMFKRPEDSAAGRISVVFVPHYTDASFLTCPECKSLAGSKHQQAVNVDLTNPCPPACR